MDIKDQIKELKQNLQNRDTWLVFLGAGASKNAGIPTMVELSDGIIKSLKSKTDNNSKLLKIIHENIGKSKSNVNVENLLEELYRLKWIRANNANLEMTFPDLKNISDTIIDESIKIIKDYVTDIVKKDFSHEDYKEFISYWFKGSKKINIFTTNWDLLIENACDELLKDNKLYISCNNGLRGLYNKKLDFDSYNVKSQKEGDSINEVTLFKLHGSIDWQLEDDDIYVNNKTKTDYPIMIYPTPAKVKESLGYPYNELFRILNEKISDQNTSKYLLAIGCSFPDDHINSIIKQAFKRKKSDFNLYTINPSLKRDVLIKIFGDYKGIAEPINMKFNDFIKELKGVI